ncbi:MAG TPA: acyltransferase [Zoogloea sp.]|nr:acyltransferase [Zoogloea sp.]
MRREASRLPAVDALKALACVLIVLHHLAFYGPMADVVRPLMPATIDFLDEYARMAVQIFLVVSGFLFASKFGPFGSASIAAPLNLLLQRYTRLVVPYSAALLLAIACSAIAGMWMDHRSISEAPSLGQLLAHVLLLHDLLDQDALSAGVWYVAIDFQLFALAILLLWLPSRLSGRVPALRLLAPALIVGMTLASLFGFNRNSLWDETALYFFGAFGLGILVAWASRQPRAGLWIGLLTLVAVAALAVDFRGRIAVATSTMLFLGLASRYGFLHTLPVPAALSRLSRISYSVFLVHFPLCLLVNAVVTGFFPVNPVINGLGMLVAVGISIAGGALFYRHVESYPFPRLARLLVPAGVVASGWLAALAAANLGG